MKIAKKDQFHPDKQKIARILYHYGLELSEYKEASTGIENTTLIVTTPKGKFVMRIYRKKKKDDAYVYRELDFMAYLRTNNLKVPKVAANKEGDFLTIEQFGNESWQIIVMEFIDGHHTDIYTPELIVELSSIQASMHYLSESYKNGDSIGEPLARLKENYFIDSIPKEKITDIRLRSFLDRAKAYEIKLPNELPQGLCHLDYDTDNVLVKNNTVTAILDFDDLRLAPFIVCLSYTLWHVYATTGKEALMSYLKNYKNQRKLSDLEQSFIKPIMLFRHYVISSIKILNNHTSSDEITTLLEQEAYLNST